MQKTAVVKVSKRIFGWRDRRNFSRETPSHRSMVLNIVRRLTIHLRPCVDFIIRYLYEIISSITSCKAFPVTQRACKDRSVKRPVERVLVVLHAKQRNSSSLRGNHTIIVGTVGPRTRNSNIHIQLLWHTQF